MRYKVTFEVDYSDIWKSKDIIVDIVDALNFNAIHIKNLEIEEVKVL